MQTYFIIHAIAGLFSFGVFNGTLDKGDAEEMGFLYTVIVAVCLIAPWVLIGAVVGGLIKKHLRGWINALPANNQRGEVTKPRIQNSKRLKSAEV